MARCSICYTVLAKGEVVTAPVIRSEIGGGRVQISGRMTTVEANDTALLLRSGSLAAPMEIIEERTIGPSLGAENIDKGFKSVVYGFSAIAVFMCVYYLLFGVFSTIALAFNLLLLVAVLSMLQATLTLPGFQRLTGVKTANSSMTAANARPSMIEAANRVPRPARSPTTGTASSTRAAGGANGLTLPRSVSLMMDPSLQAFDEALYFDCCR